MEDKKKREPDDPEQSAKFVELAEQVQTEDAEERFEEAMKRVAKSAQSTKQEPKESQSD